MPSLIEDLNTVCDDIHERWDKDMRSGKLLIALMGGIENYDPRVTRIRDALKIIDADKDARDALRPTAS